MSLLPNTKDIEDFVNSMSAEEKEELRRKSEARAQKELSRQNKKELQKAEQGIMSDVDKFPVRKVRVTHCYSCHHSLDSRKTEKCTKCGWILCNCGACGCGFSISQ
jgi:hypothetical protein